MAGSSLTPIAPDLVMHSPHVPREAGGAGAGGETYRPRASVVEMINGHEQQVYLVSDDEDDDQDGPPPASPLAQPLTAPRPTTMTTTGKRKAQAPWEFTATSAVDEGPAKRRRHDPPSSMALSTPVTPHLHHPALHQPPPSHYHMPTMNEPAAAASIYPIPETLLSPYAKSQSSYAAAEAWRPSFASSTTTTTVPRVEHVPLDDKDGHIIVREGDYITPRYQIRRLLGQGTFGKVVQCYDRKQHRDVAIKVIRAIQKYRDASQIEIRVLKCLRQNDPSNKYRCVQLLETLDFRNHVCIVSDLLDRSVFDFLKDNKFQPFPCRDIWSFAHQLLKSVAFLHRLSLIHTDLKPENVLLVDSAFDVVPTSRRSNARKKRVLRNSEIRLIDFGSATFSDEYHSGVVSTRHYRAPEIILGMGWSFPCDVWSIGCILVEFYTGEALFQTHDNLEHLAMMEMVLGKLPDDYRRKAETYKPDYFMHGRLDYPRHDTTKQSRRYVQSMKPLADIVAGPSAYAKHAREFVSLLRRLLEYDPAKRITVQEALEHPYFMLQPHELPP
ncbi:cmgc clk protein kinase [Malassezia pachydermatis]|uniref:Cmgc clk protein kinase n=1 Tax=Malassezia pachydermatis TaxID=77020 RepID=A0A0N0RS36_9BASI|nr:cmgc clk protein kinase [Malassezia pachydermatis]KOS13653.1 cmgc clk protein kinase [Malassezia pachydermatis]